MGQRGHFKSRGYFPPHPYGKGNENHLVGMGCFVHDTVVSSLKRVEFVGDTMLYIGLRGHRCNVVVLNAHAPSEERSYDSKYSFYEELEQVFNHFPKYRMQIPLEDFI